MAFRPAKPRPYISRDGRWKVIPTFSVFNLVPLEPRSVNEVQAHKEQGPMWRIIYSHRTYDLAIEEADRLVRSGLAKPNRIEFIFAEKDELAALRRGDFEVVPLAVADTDQ